MILLKLKFQIYLDYTKNMDTVLRPLPKILYFHPPKGKHCHSMAELIETLKMIDHGLYVPVVS